MLKWHTTWRWNPVRGEYETGDLPPRQGTGEISAINAFSNRTILILGGTGFLGKILLAMILDRFPEFKSLVVQVRRKKSVFGEHRFFSEVLRAPSLQPIAERIGGDSAVRQKVEIVEGDLDEVFCGIPQHRLEELKGKVEIVVNIAGLVDFDPPLDEALKPNVYGVRNVIELVRFLDAGLVHVSTSYVAGKKEGRISEDTPIDGFFPRRECDEDRRFSVTDELKWCEQFIEETRRTFASEPHLLRKHLREGGMIRAAKWGWINTYTYTKSMGEQLIAQASGLRYAIVRPSIVESSMRFPFPGWNEGLTTSAPLVFLSSDGVKGWPVREEVPLEVIPVDLVAAGILIVAAALLCGKNRPVYHLASAEQNPLMLYRLVAFSGMNARSRYKHRKEGNRLANLWRAYGNTRAITVETLHVRRIRLRRLLNIAQNALTLGEKILGARSLNLYFKRLRQARRQVRAQELLIDKFLPFLMYHNFVFETRNIREAARMLTNEDLQRLNWDPEAIDWADYWMNIHTKGVEKWIRPMFAAREVRSGFPDPRLS